MGIMRTDDILPWDNAPFTLTQFLIMVAIGLFLMTVIIFVITWLVETRIARRAVASQHAKQHQDPGLPPSPVVDDC